MGKYLYCIIKKVPSLKFKVKGIEGNEIYAIDQKNFSAVVSDTERKEYLPTRENMIVHQKALEEIFRKHTLLPISFGTVTQSDNEVKELLRENAEEIFKIFKKIENKIELGLKVFWQNMPAIFEEIVKENREIQKARSAGQVSKNVMLAVGEMIAKVLEKKKIKEAALIFQPLSKIAQEVKKNELVRDDMILNADFLVDRSKEKDFDEAISQIDKKYGQRVKFKYIGPAPLSNFVDIHLRVRDGS